MKNIKLMNFLFLGGVSLSLITFSSFAYGSSAVSCEDVMNNQLPKGVLPVDKSILDQNKTEIRGFVQAPFDTDQPQGKKIEVFYRIIPSTGSLGDKAPLVVVINGGPGYPSGAYRSYDYEASAENEPDRLSELSSKFRILMIDQRGTQGYTAPLSLKELHGDYQYVSDHFGSRQIAHDLFVVLQKVLTGKDKNNFLMIGQSYGGVVLSEYLAHPEYSIRPRLAIFSSAAIPHYNMVHVFQERRREQLRMNQSLREQIPGIESKLLKIQQRLVALGVSADFVGSLYSEFGLKTSDQHQSWQESFHKQVEEILAMDPQQFLDRMHDRENIDILNYILSSSEMTPGMTDRMLSLKDITDIPFEPWMVDEAKFLLLAGAGNEWSQQLLNSANQNPPKAPKRPSLKELNRALRQTHTLFTFAKEDPAVPYKTRLISEKLFRSSGAQFESLPGGHSAIFSAPGVQLLEETWKKVSHK